MKSHAPALRQSPPLPDDGLSRWCLEKACLTRVRVTRRLAGGGKLAQAVEGYPFSWGAIAERQEPGLLVWEFYLEDALGRFESVGRRLDELQTLLFETLEARLDCVSRSFVVGCAGPVGLGAIPWVLVPGGIANGILLCLVCKYGDSPACRQWLCAEFIPRILPESLREAESRAVQAH